MSDPNDNFSVSKKDINDVATEIEKVANMILAAASNLRNSYLYQFKNIKVGDVRTRVYNNSLIYKDKVLPFTDTTINNIKNFCDIIMAYDYDMFKDDTDSIFENAKENEEFCNYTCLLHDNVLTEFYRIEDKFKESLLMNNLNDQDEKKKSEYVSENADSTRSSSENAALKCLATSIKNYVGAFENISGFFKILCADLSTIKKYSSDARNKVGRLQYNMINVNVKRIQDSCNFYYKTAIKISCSLECIDDKPEINNDKWIVNVVITKHGDDKAFLALIEQKEELKKICGYQ